MFTCIVLILVLIMEVMEMENKKYPSSVVIKFLLCSLVGIFLFFVPISLNGKFCFKNSLF